MNVRPEAIRVADAAFDAALATGGEPGVLLEGLLLAVACYARQHGWSRDGAQRALGAAWGDCAGEHAGIQRRSCDPRGHRRGTEKGGRVNPQDLQALGTNVSAAAVILVWLWKGLLPEVRAMREHLRAIESHLSNAGQARVALEGAVKEAKEGVEFLVSRAQADSGRTTRPDGDGAGGGASV